MTEKKEYKKRLIDEKIKVLLELFGAIVIEGPKWVGKTFTSEMHSKTSVTLSEESFRNLANSNPKYIFTDERPQLIDEWQLVPKVWDSVRNECDKSPTKGNFILTGSTTLKEKDKEKVFHSGAGRFEKIKMYPMSLYESGDSSGIVSLSALKEGKKFKEGLILDGPDLKDIANFCVKGGWPETIDIKDETKFRYLPDSYVKAICNDDFFKDEEYSPVKLKQVLTSLARNEATLVSNKTIVSDIVSDPENRDEVLSSRNTLPKYLEYLKRIFVIDDVEAFSTNYKSVARLGKGAKRHLVDPSLVSSLLKLTPDKLMLNHKIFGNVFESLALRDLRIYIEHLDGLLYHFRDNLSGDEVDAILEFNDGEYAACEIKLTQNLIEEGKESLLKFYKNVKTKPKFMFIICGDINYAIRDKETGIVILPLTVLRP